MSKTLEWLESPAQDEILDYSPNNSADDSCRGYIYVMRSAGHPKDVFKVGLTRRNSEVRAAELSSTTSSPDSFLLVDDWYVSDCVRAEKLIHKELERFRLNRRREFFKAPYKEIVKIIEKVIKQFE